MLVVRLYMGEQERSGESHRGQDLIIVGVGASAGGLEALTELLQYLPSAENMALVLIQHLDPRHDSALPDLLAARTNIRVVSVQQEVRIEANHVYVISPNTVLRVRGGRLIPEKRPPENFKPIDLFLNSLAEEAGERAIGVVLSGTATDGTLGLKRVKAEGGITFAQDQTAKFDSMPRSAIAAGAVDFVLSPPQIAHELQILAQRPRQAGFGAITEPGDDASVERLLNLLRKECGVDFTQYKRPTIARRLNRRMVVRKAGSLEEYLQLVQKEPGEIEALFDDLLINVTDFFRDPDVFEAAKRLAFPAIVQHRKQPHTIRAWIPGCSTGEEVYSMAIALTEFLESQDLAPSVQMFGTDVSDRTIEIARKGIYNESAVLNVTPERLRRFFTRTDSGYQVSRAIREMCIFSRHNVAKDPPLSRMDVISCRNLLIYFAPSLQRRVISTFSYALLPTGCLILGPSETLGSLADHFSILDESRKLYCRKTTVAPQPFEFTEGRSDPLPQRVVRSLPSFSETPSRHTQVEHYADQIVLSRYGPAGIVVDESLRIKSYRGDITEYLVSSEMREGTELMTTVRPDLRAVLSTTVEQAKRSDSVVIGKKPISEKTGNEQSVAITVIPLSLGGSPMHFLILIGPDNETITEEFPETVSSDGTTAQVIPVEEENSRLKQELISTREYLQSVIEELRSTNEEAQSANEELQSTNEEMQTSKEELQSSNEELNTINAELQGRNLELAQVNDDLINLLASMNMPIVMTGRDLRIRRFTPVAEKALRLIATDIGRPIADLKPRINVPDLEDVLHQVLDSLQPYEREVEDHEGRSYLMRVRPYRTSDDRIDGTVLQLLDVSEIKRGLERAKHAREYAEAIVNTIREPIVVLDERLTIRDANQAFYDTMGLREHSAAGKPIIEASFGRFDTPPIHGLFERLKQGMTDFTDVEVESAGPESKTLVVNTRRLLSPEGEPLILAAFHDITTRKREAEARYRRLFESARDGIVIIDALTGEVLDLNPFTEQLLGYRREEVVGRKLWEIEPMMTDPNVRSATDQVRERGVVRLDQLHVRTKEGRELEVEAIASLYYEEERAAIQLNIRDVGERKRFERELQETQKLESLGLLAGGIAHDFNNLLTGILGNASLALSETAPDQAMRHYLRQIVEASERAAFLTRQMLAYAGRGRFVTASTDMSDLVREIAALVRTSIPKSVDLRLDLAPNLPNIEADPSQVQQVLMNLITNAAEAIGDSSPGSVTVRTSLREVSSQEAAELFKPDPAEAGTYLQLEVIDTGAGMAESTKARIFDPFFTTKFTGRGLGLAAVRGIVRRHRGVIFVHSAPGQGTTFRVLLPASGPGGVAQQKPEAAVASIPPGSLALLIDDEKTVLNVAQSVLSRKGMRILTAENGRKGVELFREHNRLVSVVVLDLQMPVMGGHEALTLMHEINPEVPVILLSGYDEAEVTRRFSGVKPAGFLQKPFTAQNLVATIASLLHKR
jgi:two-component system CheB/CheR fusion protein